MLEVSEEDGVDMPQIDKGQQMVVVGVMYFNTLLREEIERVFHHVAMLDITTSCGEQVREDLKCLCAGLEAHSFHLFYVVDMFGSHFFQA